MLQNEKGGVQIRLALKSLCVWTAAALIMLTAASLVLSRTGVGSQVLGYVSSALSFLCAAAAGAAAGKRTDRPLAQALVTAIALVILLLTIGFLARGRELNASGILSVTTFTIAGTLAGALLFAGKKRSRRKAGILKKPGFGKRFT